MLQTPTRFRHVARDGLLRAAPNPVGCHPSVPRPQSQCHRMSSCTCHARLPHMDEEIEHMQWQLGKRSLDSTSEKQPKHSSSKQQHFKGRASSRSTPKGQQHVFHESRQHVHRHSGSHCTAPSATVAATSMASVSTDPQDAASYDDTTAVQQQQYSLQELQQQVQHSHYYHMQLPATPPSSFDYHKARDRLLKHILQDGGCFISLATAEQSSILSHLLLFLQQKQVHEQQGTVLLLQPVDCQAHTAPASSTSEAAVSSTNSSSSSSTVVTVLAGHQHSAAAAAACSVGEVKFWCTIVPLEMLLGLAVQQQGASVSTAAVDKTLQAATLLDNNSSSSGGGAASVSSMITLDGSYASTLESSSDDWQYSSNTAGSGTHPSKATVAATGSSVASSSSSSSSSLAGKASRSANSTADALLLAAGRSCSATGALLLQAHSQKRLKCLRVGSHAEAKAVASSVVKAVTARDVISLHVKGHARAHAVAYAALEMSASLQLVDEQPVGFGVALIPGESHEHVHAVPQGHVSAGGDEGEYQHSSSRVVSDASMAVGGIGAAFYGIADGHSESGSGRNREHWLVHKHAQEVWLCVVPLGDV